VPVAPPVIVASGPDASVPAVPPTDAGSAPASAVATASAPAVVTPPPARPASAARPAPRAEPSALDQFVENPLYWGIAALLALLALFGLWRFSQRSKRDSGETSFLESRLQPDSFFGASGGQRIDTRDAAGTSSSMTYSLSQLDAIGDVDPVAEADVYLAYGRDLQAEEILKEAMRSNPERLAIRAKLLEVYAKRRDIKGFELLATQLFSLTRGEGEEWQRAQELGAQIDPENPLYRAGGAPQRPEDNVPSRTADLGAMTLPASVVPVPSQYGQMPDSQVADSQFTEVDLDLDNPDVGVPSQPGAFDATESVPPIISGDSTFTETHKMPLSANAPAAREPDDRDQPLAFDLSGINLDLEKTQPPPIAEAIETPFHDDISGQDPLARKLELAEEFQRIGDKDGARDLLREVLATASGSTKTKAQAMLEDLG
jgi:pilus assembly protein FimV